MRSRSRALAVCVADKTSEPAVWKEIQATCFELVSIRSGKQTMRLARIVAYHMNLTDQAARGDIGAAREQIAILRRLERQGILARPRPNPEPTWFEERVAAHRRMQETADFYTTLLSQLMTNDIRAAYAAQGISAADLDEITLDWIDQESTPPRVERFWRRVRRSRKGGPYAVGYGKPPVSTRFQSGRSGNAAGRPPRDDGYEGVRRSLLEPQDYQDASGRSIRTSKVAGACKQVFAKAIAGDPAARRVVARYLATLEELGMLVAPPVPEKAVRRKRPSEADQATYRGFVAFLIPCVKRQMLKLYEKRFGAVPPFETRLERDVRTWDLPEQIDGSDLAAAIRAVSIPTPGLTPAQAEDDAYAEDYEAQAGRAPDDGEDLCESDVAEDEEITSVPRPFPKDAVSKRAPARRRRP